MIYIGNNKVDEMCLGTNLVKAVFIGNTPVHITSEDCYVKFNFQYADGVHMKYYVKPLMEGGKPYNGDYIEKKSFPIGDTYYWSTFTTGPFSYGTTIKVELYRDSSTTPYETSYWVLNLGGVDENEIWIW